MTTDMHHLLASRRFLPMFVTMFLGAANDNLYKSALVVLITFGLAERAGVDAPLMVTAAAGIFIAPFFLFSAWAGQLADRFDKATIAKAVKLAEIAIMGVAAAGFYLDDVWLLMGILFCMGAQSALFGPVKYSILPQHLNEDELIAGNALFEGGTFLAILIGTIVGGLLVMTDGGPAWVSVLVIAIAASGFAASLFVPEARPLQPDLKLSVNVLGGTANMLKHAAKHRDVFVSILGISWFWLVGATFLSQFPTFAKVNLGGDEQVVTLFLAAFSVGIGVGSALCSHVLKGEISARHVPYAAAVMTVFMVDLYAAAQNVVPGGGVGAGAFLSTWSGWRITLDLLMISIAGGLYIVPLYTILQSRGAAAHRARDIAANNVYNALFMVVSALAVTGMLAAGLNVPEIFLSLAVANALVALALFRLAPDARAPSRLMGFGAIVALICGAVFAFVPPIAQDPAYHAFADTRAGLGIANAADVLSNVLFVPVGLFGLWASRGLAPGALRRALGVFFAGVVLVAPGSAYYHLSPDNATLFWDRLPMSVAFSGLLAAVLAERVGGAFAGRGVLGALVLAGLASVVYWRVSEAGGAGDLRPYALVQFGSMAAIVALMALFPRSDAVLGWRAAGLAAAGYALAKVAETFDPHIFAFLGGAVSGHTLKHLFAALAVLGVALTLGRAQRKPHP